MEINFFHGDPLGLADEVFFFKRTVREAALRHDMYATFMAKPIAGEPGSAMHVHQSIVDTATGRNIFSNEDGSPSSEFYWYIGGLQTLHAGGDGAVRAVRQLATAAWRATPPRRSTSSGAPTTAPSASASPVADAGGAARREPRDRRRRQSLRGAGRDAGLRLPRHRRAASSRRPSARATPTWRDVPAAAQPGRGARAAARRDRTCARCSASDFVTSTPRSRRSSTTSS